MHASYDQDTSDDDDTDDYDDNLKTFDHNTSYDDDDDDDDDEKAEVPWPTSALRRKSCRHSDHSYLILPT